MYDQEMAFRREKNVIKVEKRIEEGTSGITFVELTFPHIAKMMMIDKKTKKRIL